MADIEALVVDLQGDSRSIRQRAAVELAILAKEQPNDILPFIDDVIDALARPEARTRWECLDVLSCLVPLNADACDQALPDVETALFDETSGPLRYSAVRFLCLLGATSEARSIRVWPLLNEAIQCYHGDNEYEDMLSALQVFAGGALAEDVKVAFKERMSFDAETPRTTVGKRALAIINLLG